MSDQEPLFTDDEKVKEALALGHIIKFNLYLLAKATVFSSIYNNLKSTRDALAETNAIMKSFERPPKRQKS
jgi:hypothetical protein